MRQKVILIIILATALLAQAACSFIPPRDLSVDDTYSGKQVKVSQYGTLTITLQSDSITGPGWSDKANIEDITVVEQTDHKILPLKNQEVWTFNTLTSGHSTIYLESRLLSQTAGAPLKSFTLELTVLPAD
jgi:hypothetical protein